MRLMRPTPSDKSTCALAATAALSARISTASPAQNLRFMAHLAACRAQKQAARTYAIAGLMPSAHANNLFIFNALQILQRAGGGGMRPGRWFSASRWG